MTMGTDSNVEARSPAQTAPLRRYDDQPIKSAMRTLALLEFFRRRRTSASVKEISHALAMPQSSTSVLVKSLVALNYLEYDVGTRRFTPSIRVALLGDWIERAHFGNERISNAIELLHADFGETVMLGQQVRAATQYLHVVSGMNLEFPVEAGEARPVSRTGLGQVLLASKTNSEIRAIIRRNNADERTVPPQFRELSLLEEIEAIRSRGYSETMGRTTPGASTIAVLVPSWGKQSALAIGIGGPIDRIEASRREIVKALRDRLGMMT